MDRTLPACARFVLVVLVIAVTAVGATAATLPAQAHHLPPPPNPGSVPDNSPLEPADFLTLIDDRDNSTPTA
jgi:hypothetical protein